MEASAAPGFFGKVPARGDFLSRRMPASFAAAWEAWLQELTVAVRESGERGWQDAWLTAPVWHFVAGRGVAPPHGASGVLLASADRVGRLFPFSIVGAASPLAPGDSGRWSRSAEQLALGALDDAFDPGALDAALAALGPPPPAAGPNRPVGVRALRLEDDWPAHGDPFAENEAEQAGAGPDQTEWWTRGSDRMEATAVRCMGLPPRSVAERMVLGGLSGV